MKLVTPTVLINCEGFGYTTETHNNLLVQAETPFFDTLREHYPTTLLKAHGESLGYPDYYGSSPYAGFWTLISGEKNIPLITQVDAAIQNGTFFEHKTLEKFLTSLATDSHRFHIVITFSHTSLEHRSEHVLGLIHAALLYGVKEIFIHLVLTNNHSFDTQTFSFIEKLERSIASIPQVTLTSIHGSIYTNNHATQPSIENSYTVLTQPSDVPFASWKELISHYYVMGFHDNSIIPTALTPDGYIHPKDGIIFVTYNTNECHGLQELFSKKNILTHRPLSLLEENNEHTVALYHQKVFKNSTAFVLSHRDISALTFIDYDHKNKLCFYAKETFKNFYQNSTIRTIIQSTHMSTIHTNPITEAFFEALNFENHALYILNYNAAAYQALHNNFQAAVHAIENIDTQLGYIYHEVVKKRQGRLFITSSYPLLENIQTRYLSHSFSDNDNPVFFIAVDPHCVQYQSQLPLIELSDVAPFVLRHVTSRLTSYKG